MIPCLFTKYGIQLAMVSYDGNRTTVITKISHTVYGNNISNYIYKVSQYEWSRMKVMDEDELGEYVRNNYGELLL